MHGLMVSFSIANKHCDSIHAMVVPELGRIRTHYVVAELNDHVEDPKIASHTICSYRRNKLLVCNQAMSGIDCITSPSRHKPLHAWQR